MNDSKLKELEEQNKRLEAQVALLASRTALFDPAVLQNNDDEIDLKELWQAIWKGKWIIAAVTSVFAVAAVVFALMLPNEYKATAILAPASNSGGNALSKLAGQFGGLASLAGINLGGASGEDKTAIAMELIKSWGFQEQFIRENNLEVEVFAAKGWDRKNNKLIIDEDLYDPVNKKWVRDYDPNKGETAEPSSWELYEKLKERISVSQDKQTGLVNLSVEYYSPIIAKQWVELIVKQINKYLQEKDKQEAQKNIDYLARQVEKTNVAEMKSVFYQLIEEQTKTLMLAEASDEYVLKTISEAKVPEENSKPRRTLIVALATMLGGMLSILFVLTNLLKNK
jgi:uncharacterized protein involved in exopolysaccharide biosynthesis